MCMPTMVPTPLSASFSRIFFGPSVPPVMSTQTLPARAVPLLSPMYGPAPFIAAMRYSGISRSAFCTSSMSLRLVLGEVRRQVVDDQVVGRRVRREEGDVEQTRHVDRLVVVERHEPTLDLVHALADELLPRLDRDAERRPDVGLDGHDVVELRETPALGVVRVDGVDRHALLAQAIGEDELARVHVDAAEDRRDLGLGVAPVDAGVVERVLQLLGVGQRLEMVRQLVVLAPGALEEVLDAFFAAGVDLDPHAHGGLVDLA